MTGILTDQALNRGDVGRELTELRRRMQRLETARRLEAATVGAGGVRVKGGRIRIQNDAGEETLSMSSDQLTLEGQLDVTGDIMVRSLSANRRARLVEGALWIASGIPGEASGVVFGGDAGDNRPTVQVLPPRLDGDSGTNRITVEGSSPTLPGGGMFVITGGDAVFAVADTIHLDSAAGEVQAMVDNTTGSANMLITGTGPGTSERIWRVTSARAAKLDIEDVAPAPAEVLALRPRVWRDRGEVQADPGTDRWHVGLVAEEVHEAGLTEWVDYDEQGRPVSVAYDRLAVALLAVVQDQQRRLDALDGGRPATRAARTRKPKRRPARAGRRSAPPAPPVPELREPPIQRRSAGKGRG